MEDNEPRTFEVDLSSGLEVAFRFCGNTRTGHDFRGLDKYMDEYRRQKVRSTPLFQMLR